MRFRINIAAVIAADGVVAAACQALSKTAVVFLKPPILVLLFHLD